MSVVVTATLWYLPALMAMTSVRPHGTLLCPIRSLTQAATVPSERSSMLRVEPAATATTPVKPCGTVA
ncbi:hypothetical protein VR41_01015 [Streptomyces sp. NRRL B-1568]|nr:hypothetical protein VR41_01015 [Streptomyces sp. NRRL B-1568]